MESELNLNKEYLEICKRKVESKLTGIASIRLHRKDFILLIDEAFERSGILLSLSTLKRIWSSGYSTYPQVKTLDALSQYLGYRNWNHFKNCHYVEAIDNLKNRKKLAESHSRIFRISTFRKFLDYFQNNWDGKARWYIGLLIIILLIIILFAS